MVQGSAGSDCGMVSYVGWVCCWFLPCYEDFSLGSLVFFPPQKSSSPNSNLTKIEDPHENQLRLMWLPLLILFFIYCFFLNSRKSNTLVVQLIMMLKSCILPRFIWNKLLQVRIPLKSTTNEMIEMWPVHLLYGNWFQ